MKIFLPYQWRDKGTGNPMLTVDPETINPELCDHSAFVALDVCKQAGIVEQVTELHCRPLPVTDAGLDHLVMFNRLTSLSLKRTKVTDAGLEKLKALVEIVDLDLEDTGIGDAGVVHLVGLANLAKLTLCGTLVTDVGLAVLRQLPGLRKLQLNHTAVTDTGLRVLKGLPLEQLWVGWTKITGVGIEELKGMTTLRELCLHGLRREATSEAAEALKSALPGCTVYGP